MTGKKNRRPVSPHSINLQDPLQGRRWLQLLVPDPGCGFRLQPQLDVPQSTLGFSLRSNRFGLRGPDDDQGDNVILGTSFAMGIAVNNGENWWELGLPNAGWMNLGLAVGFREWNDLLGRFYRGNFQRAWLLYHPNFWAHCRMYERWRQNGQEIFEALRWRRDLVGCDQLKARRIWRRPRLIRSGRLLKISHGGLPMEIDAEYTHLELEQSRDLFERNLRILGEILSRFREVNIVRIRAKQEAVPPADGNEVLAATCHGYDRWFEATRAGLAHLPQVRVLEEPAMGLENFHARDSHWNSQGNRRFASWLQERIKSI